MNSRIKEKKEPDNFKPFTLEIDVDTLDELKYLWMMFNLGVETIAEENDKCGYYITDKKNVKLEKSYVWDIIDNKLDEELKK